MRSTSKTVRQVNLERGASRLTAWIDDVPELRPGVEVTLKGEEGRWRVAEVGSIVMERADLNTDWAVGGL